jgi:hypothetical protein
MWLARRAIVYYIFVSKKIWSYSATTNATGHAYLTLYVNKTYLSASTLGSLALPIVYF